MLFLAAGSISGSSDQKGCKKSHSVDIYLIQFSVPYVFKRLKKQIRYARHEGEDIFQCSFMSAFFGNNVGLSTIFIMLVVSYNLCVRLILINNYGQYHFVNLLSPISFALEIIAPCSAPRSVLCFVWRCHNLRSKHIKLWESIISNG